MDVDYRPLRHSEEEAVLDLWLEAFPGRDREQRRRAIGNDEDWHAHTVVAAAPDGRLLSSAHYWPLQIRDGRGRPCRVGGVSHVATLVAARRQGHAGRLLDLLIEMMRREGCAWSFLFASAAGRTLYERHGWRTFLAEKRAGMVAYDRPAEHPSYVIRRYDPAAERDGWLALAAVYDAYNATRPLSLVRTDEYWRGYYARRVAERIAPPGGFFVAERPGGADELVGYALVAVGSVGFEVLELGVRQGEDGAVVPLLHAIADEAQRRGAAHGTIWSPRDVVTDVAVVSVFGASVRVVPDDHLLGRSIDPRSGAETLAVATAASGAWFWPSDAF